MAGVTGDFAELAKILGSFAGAGGGLLAAQARKLMAAEALTQVQLGFRESRDPYGEAWEKTNWSSPKPLRDSGRLANSFSSAPTPQGFQVGTNVKYAVTHQYGLTIKPKRGKVLAWKGSVIGYGIAQKKTKSGKIKSTKGSAIYQMHFAKSVKIRQRKMVPEGKWGDIWHKAMAGVSQRALQRWFTV